MSFRVFIDQQELIGWTEATLERQKKNLTGILTLQMFFTFIPDKPTFADVTRGKDITVYVGGQLAFTGRIDKRQGRSLPSRDSRGRFVSGTTGTGSFDIESSISNDNYLITITARGKTKYLVDSSHRHPTTNIADTTDKKTLEALIRGQPVELDWRSPEVKLPIVRLRDGSLILDELHRICNENCHYVYEGRDGRLIVSDTAQGEMGDDLILGKNILSFSASQSEDRANSEIIVKGHRTGNELWGREAVIEREKTLKDDWVQTTTPLVIQHYGDATDEALERRGKFEADKRAAESKQVVLDVFHVQTPSGQPWDIGNLHYIEVPPEGVFDVMECTGIKYNVTPNLVRTTLTFTPPPTPEIKGSKSSSLTSEPTPGADNVANASNSRSRNTEASIEGKYPAKWTSAQLNVTPTTVNMPEINTLTSNKLGFSNQRPPMTLPDGAK